MTAERVALRLRAGLKYTMAGDDSDLFSGPSSSTTKVGLGSEVRNSAMLRLAKSAYIAADP